MPENLSLRKMPGNSSASLVTSRARRLRPTASAAATTASSRSPHLPTPEPVRPCAGLDPLGWIHAVTAHIPDRGRGAFAYRARSPKASSERRTAPAAGPGVMPDTASEFVQRRQASWPRLIKKIFDVDPQIADCHRSRAAAVSWPPGSSRNPLGLPQPQALANATYCLGLCIKFMTLTLFYISRETPIPLHRNAFEAKPVRN